MSYLSLFELNKLVKNALSTHLEPSYWVVAEIGEIRLTQKGHCYLELIEKDSQQLLAKTRATIWSYTYRNLNGWFEAITGESLKGGMNILCQVEVAYHEVYGISLNIKDIDANFTLGERARKKQEVLNRLADEGVLEMNKSLLLPIVPQKIAVISSPTAAGLGDFLDQLSSNRYAYHFEIKLYRALMQGNQAEESIVNAMLEVYQELEQEDDVYDVLVIIRGGGAQVDLDCFDGYEVAAHIAQFPIPVITGIGHERDETVADIVAHTRMKTPTAVAEFLINGVLSFDEKLETLWHSLSQKAQYNLKEYTFALDNLSNALKFAANSILQQQRHQLEQAQHQLRYYSRQQIKVEKDGLEQFRKKLEGASQKKLVSLREKLNYYEKYLLASDPEHLLKKGFTYTSINGHPLQKVIQMYEGDVLETISFQHILRSKLENIQNRQKHESQKEK